MSDTDVLRVDGDNGDALKVAGNGWIAGADFNVGGQLYHSYSLAGATLVVDADIATSIAMA